MNNQYFLLYLVYGFAMINMGLFCLKEKDSSLLDLPIVKSLKYLGYFGVVHGITEWIQMLTIVDIYPHLFGWLYNGNLMLKGISFAFLLYFGLSLLPIKEKYRKMILHLPVGLCGIYLAGFLALAWKYGLAYHVENTMYTIVMMRYLLALTSGIVTAIALFGNAQVIARMKSIKVAKRYQSLGWIFIFNALLEGLLVKEAYFFPANIVNREIFHVFFRFPTLFLKAAVGLVINFLLSKLLDTFRWEQEEKLGRLEQGRIASEERKKLGLEIHDSIIQKMYATGLKMEYLLIKSKDHPSKDMLEEIKTEMNHTIDKTREFISATTMGIIGIEEIKEHLDEFILKYNYNNGTRIRIECGAPETNKPLPADKSNQLYYIVQEAICNVIKHSMATDAKVMLSAREDGVFASVEDNGIGISLDEIDRTKQFGIQSMKDRTERLGGTFWIERIKKGTRIQILVPWEVEC